MAYAAISFVDGITSDYEIARVKYLRGFLASLRLKHARKQTSSRARFGRLEFEAKWLASGYASQMWGCAIRWYCAADKHVHREHMVVNSNQVGLFLSEVAAESDTNRTCWACREEDPSAQRS